MKEIDFVILLYGFGAAYLELGGHEVNNIIKAPFTPNVSVAIVITRCISDYFCHNLD